MKYNIKYKMWRGFMNGGRIKQKPLVGHKVLRWSNCSADFLVDDEEAKLGEGLRRAEIG
jgi:hypothetical protein